MNAHPVLLQMKYAHVIEGFSRRVNITSRKAMDFFYHSTTYQLMSRGISDMHCRSDEYLVDELQIEYELRQRSMQDSREARTPNEVSVSYLIG